MTHCPIEGCEYSAEGMESVRGHVMAKQDEPHSGYNYNEIEDMIDTGSESEETTDSGVETATPEFPDPDETPDETDETPVCPDCGASNIEPASSVKERMPGEPTDLLDKYDSVCMECGEVFNE